MARRCESISGYCRDNFKKCLRLNYKKLFVKRMPIAEWLPRYTVSWFVRDLLAGLTVTLTSIPQSIALADVAGLSSEYGLYSSLLGGVIYAIFGTCKDLNLGPTSILALMLEPYVAQMGPDAAVFMCFVSGAITLILGVLNLGFAIEFFSYPIVAGFTCAASVEIASTQINNLFGIPHKGEDFLQAWEMFFDYFYELKKWDTVLGLTSVAVLIGLRELKRFGTLKFRQDWSKRRNILGVVFFMLSLARNAIVVIGGTLLAYCLRDRQPFSLTAQIDGGLPSVKVPPFSTTYKGNYYSFGDMISNFGASLIFIPLVGILETVTVSKTFANGKAVDGTQEILTLGTGNILASFISSIPMTGSFTRSAINNSAGVKTPLAGAVTSIFTLLAVAFLTPTFRYVPKPILAAVIITSMIYLFHYETFPVLWKNRKLDLLPFLITFLCGLFIKLEYGILLGIVVNLSFILYGTARPKFNVTVEMISSQGNAVVITPKNTLYFPAAEYLRNFIMQHKDEDRILVLDGKYMRNIDITLAKSIVSFTNEMAANGQTIVLWNFKSSVQQVCIGIDSSAENYFKSGKLEEIIVTKATPIKEKNGFV